MTKFNDAFEKDANHCDDVGDAIREDRPLRKSHRYRFRLATENLDFQSVDVADPVPTGRQILEAAGLDAEQDYSLFAIVPSGDFEDVRLNETFDLRARGVERFVVFLGDRLFKFRMNNRQLSWGLASIQGDQLYQLAQVEDHQAVFRDIRGGTDQLIELGDSIDLTQPEVERFITATKPTSIKIFVNTRPHEVAGPIITYEQLVELSHPGNQDPNVIYTITYKQAATQPPAGELNPGCTLRIKQGTRIHVSPTIQS
ncbi:multiubiquitin domain-containing protein [Rhodopirellula bahusiensis]|uniref:multiubiquitin domain-containing protein n=1 Tax=Rhodopirellula bahusiensis TaxID=2014065 RepID=UPI003267E898